MSKISRALSLSDAESGFSIQFLTRTHNPFNSFIHSKSINKHNAKRSNPESIDARNAKRSNPKNIGKHNVFRTSNTHTH